MKRTRKEKFLREKFDDATDQPKLGRQIRAERRLWKKQMSKLQRKKVNQNEDVS